MKNSSSKSGYLSDSRKRTVYIYIIPVTHVTLEGKSQCVCVCAAPYRENCEAMHYNVLQQTRCWTLCRAVFWTVSLKTELLGVKLTTKFHRQCHKTLISAQCVNCSGCVVTINVMIPTSKFPVVVSRSKYT
jgi:hypothetical protein